MVNLPIYVGSVPTEHLSTFNEKLGASLQRIVSEGLDMQRMAMVLNRDERQVGYFCYLKYSVSRSMALRSCEAN